MKIKKICSSILAFAILISSLSLSTFANGVIAIGGTTPVYLGKNFNLKNWVTCTVPSFNGVPNRVPGDAAFFSNKGEIKLNINDQNRSYFENGGSVNVYVNKACNAWNLNPLNWTTDFLAYGPKNGINSFKIKGPNQSAFHLFDKLLSSFSPTSGLTTPGVNFGLSAVAFGVSAYVLFKKVSCRYGTIFCLCELAYPFLRPILKRFLHPIDNLLDNVNENKIAFDYGIVLTDQSDEKVLNPNIPKVGEINEKAFNEWKKQKIKENKILSEDEEICINDYRFPLRRNIPSNCLSNFRYTEDEINKMKNDIEQNKPITYAKLANTVPINDGLVCTLDKDHPSQTFRFVINNQFPENPYNADLFALALQNNSINLNQADSKVNFIVAYNAISSDSDINNRLINVPSDIQQKIDLINHVGRSGFLSNIFNSISGFFKKHFTSEKFPVAPEDEQNLDWFEKKWRSCFSDNKSQNNAPNPATGTVPEPGRVDAGTGDDPLSAEAMNAIRSKNAEYLRQATAAYNNNPTNVNAKNLNRAKAAYEKNEHLGQNIAQNIQNAYNQIPAPPPPQPQRHWWQWR